MDNASKYLSRNVLRSKYPAVQLTVNEVNVSFGRANNQAAPLVQGRYALLLNTDAFVTLDTLAKTVAWMDAHPNCGVLDVKLTDGAGALQPSCRHFPTPFNSFMTRTGLRCLFPWGQLVDKMAWDHTVVREYNWVPGCYYQIRREVLDQVSLFDPQYFMYVEEVGHCRRVKAAVWKVVYYPDTSVGHIGGKSAKFTGAVTEAGRQISTLQFESELLFLANITARWA